jgi:gamma-glutamyltranspeptidase
MVTAEHPLGARVGARVLERGGNAIDAAVATAFAMTVVEPFMSTMAGSDTMLVHMARRGETVAFDFNGCAPMRAHESMFRVTTGISRGLFGSLVVVPGTGILLNNGMIWFNPEPGRLNSVAPGKRALVNMVPVLGFKKGEPYLTLGAPGGRRIVSAIPQVIARLVDSRCDLQAAIEAPCLHAEDTEVLVDARVGEKALAALGRLGQRALAREETYATLNFAKPVGVRVGRHGLEAGLDALRPAAAAGH